MNPQDGYIQYIVNPKSGASSGKHMVTQLKDYLVEKGYDVRMTLTESLEHACELATQAAVDYQCVLVIAGGGDGTLREVLHGLEGSNKNAAYAGSKFGTLGLTQSFAKELVTDRIKVNSICPGNYFDGPLWSDPERGLFTQYLTAGKVPGAKTIEEVRRFYEEKVPIQRGCTPTDVVKAILYAVDQDYETGQAIPVTGGQVMLK